MLKMFLPILMEIVFFQSPKLLCMCYLTYIDFALFDLIGVSVGGCKRGALVKVH